MCEVCQQEEATIPAKFITGYFVAGFPTKEKSIAIIEQAVQAGVNVIELGFPSHHPYMDGDTIQEAHAQVLDQFPTLDDYIAYVQEVRAKVSAPIWIMGYQQDLLKDEQYLTLAQSSYIDGFVIPDLPREQQTEVQAKLQQENVRLVPVINHNMTDEEMIAWMAEHDVVYCQLYAGKTGAAFTNSSALPAFYKRLKRLTDAKLMAGFGIKNSSNAEDIFQVGYDGIVIGSEFMRLVTAERETQLYKLIQQLVSTKEKWG